jgi:formyl-CoA transferase
MTGPAAPLPLEGVRVIEFTHMVMGPTCGMVLADLGAEVIKIEPPGGDRTRDLPGLGRGFFRTFNRNKKSVALDVQTPEGLATARELVATCDVLLENFRPGQMGKLGLDYATLAVSHPRLIYVSHKGFLPGPYEHRTALDEVVQMMGGLAYMTGPPGRPLRAGTSVNDILGGVFGALGVLAALRVRDATGRGQELQIGLYENCAFLVAQHVQQYLMSGEPPPPMPARISAWSVYDVFTVAEGEQLFVAATSDRQFQALCRVLERPDLAGDPELATNAQRVAVRARLVETLAATFASQRKDELAAKLEAAGLPYAPIARPEQLVEDPHLVANGSIVPIVAEDGAATRTVLLPFTLDGRRPGVRRPLPRVGEHTAEVLTDLERRRGARTTSGEGDGD